MRFSSLIATAITATAVVAAPVEKRAVTTTWVIDYITSYTTVYATPSAAATASAVNALQGGGHGGSHHSHSHSYVTQHSTTTVAETTTAVETPAPTPTTTSVESPAPVPTTSSSVEAPTTTSASTPTSGGSSGPAESSACTTWSSSTPDFNTPPVSCGISILDTANKWRKAYGKAEFTWSSSMAKAAWNTVSLNQGGVTMDHHVPSNAGETITPGFWIPGPKMDLQGDSPFEVALMGWLCEDSGDAQLQPSANGGVDQCDISRNVASISGSKDGTDGHHKIFLTDSYSTIGCAYMDDANGDGGWPQFAGQWSCDFQ